MIRSTALEDLQVWPSMTYQYHFDQGFNLVIQRARRADDEGSVQSFRSPSKVRSPMEDPHRSTRDMARVT